MSVYHYQALDKKGMAVIGLVKADSRFEAEKKIKASKLELVSIDLKTPLVDRILHRFSFGRVSAWEKSTIYRQVATMIKAGVPLVRALQVVAKTDNPTLQRTLSAIIRDIREGKSFSTACAKHPKFFNPVDLHILESGEATGTLELVLFKMADQKEKEASLRKKIQGALVYPSFVVLVIIGVIILMITQVVPVLQETFAEADAALPISTRILIWLSEAFLNYWWLIIIFLAAIIILTVFYVRSTFIGKYLWSLFKLRVPIFGKLHRDVSLSQICTTLALLISSGVPIVQSIQLTSGVTGSEIFRKSFDKIGKELEKGVPVSAGLEVFSKIFPSIMINMVSVGEESGTIDQMLITLGHYYEEEADSRVKTLSSALEPILLVILGLGVAFVVFAIMIPIYSLANIYE